MDIAEESTNQIHSLKWRCWNAEIKRNTPVTKKIAANQSVIASSAGIGKDQVKIAVAI